MTKHDIAQSRPAMERRRLFITLYCHPDYARNATRAAIDAGYSPTSARQIASKLLKNEDIRQEIDAALARQIERTDVSADQVVKEMARIGFVNLRDILEVRMVKQRGGSLKPVVSLKAESLGRLHPDDTAAIRELDITKDGIRVRLHDKMAALMGLSKHLAGHFRDPVSAPQRPRYTTEERLALMVGLLQVFAKRRQEAIAAGHTEPLPVRGG